MASFAPKRKPEQQGMNTVWRCPGSHQILEIQHEVISHMGRHRQVKRGAREAGGQLFGTVTPDTVRVLSATGPYHGDERSRYRYRSAPKAAQLAIRKEARLGRVYLGEWHTHAEAEPRPSGFDVDVMDTILRRSKLNTTSLLLVIVGQTTLPSSLGIWSFSIEGRLEWSRHAIPEGT